MYATMTSRAYSRLLIGFLVLLQSLRSLGRGGRNPVAHLGRLVNTPTIALFGPGSAVLFGASKFWKNSLYHAVTIENFPCRDQKTF
jgi:hypothetical protein